MRRRLFPFAGTALLAGTLAVRVLRLLGNWESVRRFYPGGQGVVWGLLGLALLFGPYLAAGSAAAISAATLLRALRAGRRGSSSNEQRGT